MSIGETLKVRPMKFEGTFVAQSCTICLNLFWNGTKTPIVNMNNVLTIFQQRWIWNVLVRSVQNEECNGNWRRRRGLNVTSTYTLEREFSNISEAIIFHYGLKVCLKSYLSTHEERRTRRVRRRFITLAYLAMTSLYPKNSMPFIVVSYQIRVLLTFFHYYTQWAKSFVWTT